MAAFGSRPIFNRMERGHPSGIRCRHLTTLVDPKLSAVKLPNILGAGDFNGTKTTKSKFPCKKNKK